MEYRKRSKTSKTGAGQRGWMELPALSDLFFCGTGSGDSGRKLDVWQELAAIFTRRAKQQDDRLGRRMDQLGSRAECVETDAGKRRKVFLSSAAQAGGRDAGLDTGTHSLCCSGFLCTGALRRIFHGMGYYHVYAGKRNVWTAGVFAVLFSAVPFLYSGLESVCLVGTVGKPQAEGASHFSGSRIFRTGGGGRGLLEPVFP